VMAVRKDRRAAVSGQRQRADHPLSAAGAASL
jgi:hypothetical protein